MKNKNNSKKRLIAGILGPVLALIVMFLLPIPEGLTHNSMIVIGLFVGALVYWIFNVFGFFVTTILLTSLFVLTKAVPLNVAFSGVLTSTWWFMFGAMGFTVALSKTGLMRRIAFNVMKVFPASFTGNVLAVMASGLLVNPIIPSVTAKNNMMMPIARGIADSMGYEKKSNEIHGIWLAALTSVTLFSYAFSSSNFFSLYAIGLLPQETVSEFGWTRWLIASLPWLIIVAVAMFFGIKLMYCSKTANNESKMDSDYIKKQLAEMGKMSRDEKLTAALLVICVILWVTESKTGLSSAMVTIVAMMILMMANVFKVPDMKSGIPWDMLLMVGAVSGLGTVFTTVGINTWISSICEPLVSVVAGNEYIFVISLTIIIYLIMFVYANVMALLVIFVPLLLPFAMSAGISPWVISFVILVSAATWTVIYQNGFGLVGYGLFGGDEVLEYNKLSKLSLVYMVVNLLALIASIPYWHLLGIIA